jgi:nickel/cobalt exporter
LVGDPTLSFLKKTEPEPALRERATIDLKSGDEARLRKVTATFEVFAVQPKNRDDGGDWPAKVDVSGSARRYPPAESRQLPDRIQSPPGEWKPTPEERKPPEVEEPALVKSAERKAPLNEAEQQKVEETASIKDPSVEGKREATTHSRSSLLALLDTDHGFWALLALAAVLGAAHALTPGHGKTLVAAYLVGERGTVGHAVLLGIVTTLTHTSSVLALAAILWYYIPKGGLSEVAQQNLQVALEMLGGVLVAGLGFWLLLRRLAGRADHVHIGGGHHHHHHHHGHDHAHHHHHGDADHTHDDHGHVVPLATQPVGWWGLVVLGISGGLVPCGDAIVMLVFAVTMNLLWLALPLLLAFSAGLAGVLVAIGIVVVKARGLLGSHWGESAFVRALPLVSAVLVTGLGLWMCYDSLHGG